MKKRWKVLFLIFSSCDESLWWLEKSPFTILLNFGVGRNLALRILPTARNSVFQTSAFPFHSTFFPLRFFEHKVSCVRGPRAKGNIGLTKHRAEKCRGEGTQGWSNIRMREHMVKGISVWGNVGLREHRDKRISGWWYPAQREHRTAENQAGA